MCVTTGLYKIYIILFNYKGIYSFFTNTEGQNTIHQEIPIM